MEKALALLKNQDMLQQWSDLKILPGQLISKEIREKMSQANIVVFLLSPDFIASKECKKEWDFAEQLSKEGKLTFRIPVIVRECSWTDMLVQDDLKALPKDGKAVTQYASEDAAWLEVYEGIKAVVNVLRQTFRPKEVFLSELDDTEFISTDRIKLSESFVFPRMTRNVPSDTDRQSVPANVTSQSELLKIKYSIIHGQEKAGKTALARHLFLSLVEKCRPVLLVDLSQASAVRRRSFFEDVYHTQFEGDYSIWTQQENKTLILENMSSARRVLEFVISAIDKFERIIITLGSDAFYAYFKDEERLADFEELKIEPLTRVQQEQLIRKKLAITDATSPVADGLVDQMDAHVNSIVVSNKVVPRYPFFVLSILQSQERYMPGDLSITSYGHCYFVLIVGSLFQAGISKEDKDVNTCFNFAEHLAYAIYEHDVEHEGPFDYESFKEEYKTRFIIRESTINRLADSNYGIINSHGTFKKDYVYYYFLGKYLSRDEMLESTTVEQMLVDSHLESSYLTLLFMIHHSRNHVILDEILLRTLLAFDAFAPATLSPEETSRFHQVVDALPDSILSNRSVPDNRRDVKELEDKLDQLSEKTEDPPSHGADRFNKANDVYKILRNNKILAQALRSKHGTLERKKVEETIEFIADSGFRLVNAVLADEEEISRLARFVAKKHPDLDRNKVGYVIDVLAFMWTMINIEHVVECVNIPEIREAVESVVSEHNTPAYDLVGFFSHLDSATKLSQRHVRYLDNVLKKNADEFVLRVIRLRTEHYLNTHRSDAPIEQAICSRLGIPYFQRPRVATQ